MRGGVYQELTKVSELSLSQVVNTVSDGVEHRQKIAANKYVQIVATPGAHARGQKKVISCSLAQYKNARP